MIRSQTTDVPAFEYDPKADDLSNKLAFVTAFAKQNKLREGASEAERLQFYEEHEELIRYSYCHQTRANWAANPAESIGRLFAAGTA